MGPGPQGILKKIVLKACLKRLGPKILSFENPWGPQTLGPVAIKAGSLGLGLKLNESFRARRWARLGHILFIDPKVLSKDGAGGS